MCCVTCCHCLCDISITKRKLCLIMQVEMAKKTQGCISYGFPSAKQRKDSFVSCYYNGWHFKAPLLALCAWNSLSLGLISLFYLFCHKCNYHLQVQRNRLWAVQVTLLSLSASLFFLLIFFFSVQQAQQTSLKKGTAFSLLKEEKDRLKVARNPMRNHRAFTQWAPSKKNVCWKTKTT